MEPKDPIADPPPKSSTLGSASQDFCFASFWGYNHFNPGIQLNTRVIFS